METLAMSTDSFQPTAAVSKRLLTSQVENQAQQRRFPPLQKGTSGDEVGNVGFYIQGMREVGQTYDWSHISLLFSTRVANQIILYYDRRWSSRWWIYLVSCRLKKSRERVSPSSHRNPLMSPSLQSLWCRAPGGEKQRKGETDECYSREVNQITSHYLL